MATASRHGLENAQRASLIPPGLARLIWTVALLLGLIPSRAGAEPRLEADSTTWNFGSISNRQEISHDFKISNRGSASLKISRVLSSCPACLSASVEKKSLAPDESCLLRCRLNLRHLAGTVSRTITLSSNDPDRPRLVFDVAGVFVPFFEVSPPELLLDLNDEAQMAMAQILPLVQLHAPLARVELDNTNMIAQLLTNGPSRFALLVRPLPSLPRGRFQFRAILTSGNSLDPACVVDGSVNNPPDLEVFPPSLQFQPKAEPQTRMLWLRQRGSGPMTLVDVLVPSAKMRALVEPDPSGYNYRIEITAWESDPSPGPDQAVVLKLRDPSNHEQRLSVPIQVEAEDSATE